MRCVSYFGTQALSWYDTTKEGGWIYRGAFNEISHNTIPDHSKHKAIVYSFYSYYRWKIYSYSSKLPEKVK
jgi:hypothetical protein